MGRWPEERSEELVARYLAGESGEKLAAEVGLTQMPFYRQLRLRGVVLRGRGVHQRMQNPIREDAFDAPGPEGRYWLGFIMADGCITGRGGATLAVGLSEKDIDHLRALAEFLQCRNVIFTRQQKGGFAGGAISTFRVSSKRLAAGLAKHGILPRKSAREEALLGLEDDPDFWRGVIDGDGCIYDGDENTAIVLCGGRKLIRQFKAFTDLCLPSPRRGGRAIEERSGIYYLTVGGKAAVDLARLLYSRQGPALARKAAIARRLISYP